MEKSTFFSNPPSPRKYAKDDMTLRSHKKSVYVLPLQYSLDDSDEVSLSLKRIPATRRRPQTKQ